MTEGLKAFLRGNMFTPSAVEIRCRYGSSPPTHIKGKKACGQLADFYVAFVDFEGRAWPSWMHATPCCADHAAILVMGDATAPGWQVYSVVRRGHLSAGAPFSREVNEDGS